MKNQNSIYMLIALIGIVVIGGFAFTNFSGIQNPVTETQTQSDVTTTQETSTNEETEKNELRTIDVENYDPIIDPSNFVDYVDNKYWNLVPGSKYVYEAVNEDGTETIEVFVTTEEKTVLGIPMTVVWDRVWLEGDLIEDTKDWYAQDKQGNVWYFGEDTMEIAQGVVINHAGAFESGVDGAEPGIIMLADPRVGDAYIQEQYKGVAEDRGEIVAIGDSVTVPFGTFNDCLVVKEWNPLEEDSDEHKYSCANVGFTVLELSLEDGERAELISYETNAEPSPSYPTGGPEEIKTQVTEAQAKSIALTEVPGIVTDVEKEGKFGKLVYTVEIKATGGPETDVVIEIETGEVLSIET